MERRLTLAIALSLLVLMSWSAWVSKTYHPENKEVTTKNAPPINIPYQPAPSLVVERVPPPASLFKFTQEKLEITFIEPQAAIKEVVFKAYQNYKLPLRNGFFLVDNALLFKKESSSNAAVTFIHRDQNKEITKKFIFSNANYTIDLDIEMQNLSALPLKMNLPLILGALYFDPKNIQARYQEVTVATKDKVLHPNAHKDVDFEKVNFLALRDRYFCALVEPESDNYGGFIRKISPQESEIGLKPTEITLLPGQSTKQKFRIYLGPQELKIINHVKPEWSTVVYYGTFDFISQMLLRLLGFLFQLVHNWGLAIVILSLVIYAVLYPLTLKQMRSMKEMQALQPQIEELRKTCKDNPQKLNKEIMELYRQHKVNPMGGCLPLILQIPIFFALYQALLRSVVLKGANFLWIKDLSEPDRLFLLPKSLPIIGNEINILPVIMAIGMFSQQKLSMAKSGGAAAEQQKLMLIMFPLMFGFIFYRMPAGLVLYWFINSTLTLIYQFRISQEK